MKKSLILFLKIGGSIAILAFLFWLATRDAKGREAFLELLKQPKRWEVLAAAWVVCVLGVTLTLVRWCYLVRALGIPFPMRDAMRIGWIGFVFNFLPAGIVGGDVLKGIMLAHEHPGNRVKAAASVIVDRLMGLYVLFLMATAAIFATGFWYLKDPDVHVACDIVLGLTAVSSVGVIAVLVPGVLTSRWVSALGRLPRIGGLIRNLVEAIEMYRRNTRVLVVGTVMSFVLQLLLLTSIYLVSEGLNFPATLANFCTIYPVSGVASTIPLSAGPFEGCVVLLYPAALGATADNLLGLQQQALIVGVTYKLVQILIIPIGIGYYLAGRREVREVIQEEEQEAHRD